MSVHKYFSPSCNLFGYNCIEGLEDELKIRGYRKALIVTDKSIVQLGIADKVVAVLDKAGIAHVLFGEVKPNPTVTNVNNGLAKLQAERCDFVVTIGGGSSHDCGKAIAILATNGGKVEDYKEQDKSKEKGLDIVAINTTAGTGSECTRAYVISDEEKRTKTGIRDRHALATIAVDDHALMMTLPKSITAATGMDALVHAVECYVSKNGFLLTSELALAAIRCVFKWLPVAVNEPSNQEGREGMATAEYLAGLAFGNGGVGMVHAMSHQLSAIYDLPHGLCNAILLPPVMEFNKRAVAAKLGEIGSFLKPFDAVGKSDDEKANIAIDEFRRLSSEIGTCVPLHTLGVKESDFRLLAEKTLTDGSLGNNPVQPTIDEIIAILKSVY